MSISCSIGTNCDPCTEDNRNFCTSCFTTHSLPRFDNETNTHRVAAHGCDLLLSDELVWHG